jgi:hypothetical protein
MAMIFGVQQSYTRRRLAEMDIRFHDIHFSGIEESEISEEAVEPTAPDDAALSADKPEQSSAAAYLQQHLRGVPDVQRDSAAAAAAAAASSTVVSVTSSAVRFSAAGRDSSPPAVDPDAGSGPYGPESSELGVPAAPAIRSPAAAGAGDAAAGGGEAGLSP